MRELANPEIFTLMLESQDETTVAARLHHPADTPFRERFRLQPVSVAALTIGLLFFAGCGPRSDRLEISGNVTLDAAPLDGGTIRFTSTSLQKLIASGAVIANGEYTIPQEKGLLPGTYLVEISAPDTSGNLVVHPTAPGEPKLPPTARERIPAEYNSNSKQSVEVTEDGENHFEFNILTRAAK